MEKIEVNINDVPLLGVRVVDFDPDENCMFFHMEDGRILVVGNVVKSARRRRF